VRTRTLTPNDMDKIVFPTVELFLEGWTVAEIRQAVRERYGVHLSREGVYPIIREAVRRDHLLYMPPLQQHVKSALADVPNKGDIHVVDVAGEHTSEHVAGVGADLIAQLVREVGAKKGKDADVHIGLGIGQTTMRAARRLAAHLRSDMSFPRIVVHSLSTPHSVHDPLETPLASFALFQEAHKKPGYIDLVTEPVVPWNEYEKVKKLKHVAKAFAAAKDIDILLTSMASARDPHGYLVRYVQDFRGARESREAKAALVQDGWIGDVQMRPYSSQGPIKIKKGGKPVSLFELDGLVEMAHTPDKHVILLCAPCGRCSQSKAEALMPLLVEPKLHVWNHLVLDVGTGQEIVKKRMEG